MNYIKPSQKILICELLEQVITKCIIILHVFKLGAAYF